MPKIVVTGTDKNTEKFVLPMVTSFLKFNFGVNIYCIVTDDVSEWIKSRLRHLEVKLLKYRPELTSHIKHISLVIPEYIPEFTKMLWLDIDMLVLDSILDVFDIDADIVGHAGFSEGDWITRTNENEKYITTGVFAMTYEAAKKICEAYKKHGEPTNSDGKFLREHCSGRIHQLNSGEFVFANLLIEQAEYKNTIVSYQHKGKTYYPKVAHFSKHYSGRSRSDALDNWSLDYGVQLRHGS